MLVSSQPNGPTLVGVGSSALEYRYLSGRVMSLLGAML